MKELVTLIASLTGFEGHIARDTAKPNGRPLRWLDTTCAERAFGFKTRMPLDEGLRKTIQWYQRTHRLSQRNSQGDRPS